MSHSPLCELAWLAKSLSITAHIAHFNVTGESFGQLHKLYRKIYEESDGWFDMIGERVRALDMMVEPYDVELLDTKPEPDYLDYVESALQETTEKFSKAMADSDDIVTQNMLIGIVEQLQKFTWMVQASKCIDD